MCRLFVIAGCLIIGLSSNSHAEYAVRFEPTITGSDVSGHDDKFRELFQIPEDASGGLGLLSFDGLIPTGQELHLDISAQYDDEYKAGIQLRGKELWTLDLKFQGFKTYSNNASEYYTFAPAAFALDRDLDVNRGDLSFKFSLHPSKLPHFSFGYERKDKDGDQLLLQRGQVDSVSFYNIPLSSDTSYNTSDIFTFELSHTLKETNLSLTQRLERFESRVKTDQTQYDSALGFYTRSQQEEKPEFHNATTTFSVNRTFRKNIFAFGQYWYRDVESDTDYSKAVYSPVSGLLENTFNTADTDSDADLTMHMFLLNLNYLFRPSLSFFGGVRYVDSDKDATSLNVRRNITGVVDLTENGTADVNERTWSGIAGFKFSGIPRATLDYEARLDRSDVDFDERLRSSRGFIGTFARDTDADFDTTAHRVRLSVRPCRQFFFLGQYRYDKFDNEYDDDIDTTLGYPAFLGDRDNETNDFTLKTRIRLLRQLSLTFKYQDKDVDYDISQEAASKVAETDTENFNVFLNYNPMGNLFLSFMFNHQDTETKTRGQVDDRNFPYDLEVDSFISTVNFVWNEKLSFSGTINYAEADGTTQNVGGDGTVGKMPLDYTLQSYSLGIKYNKSPLFNWQLKYMYADYEEDGMGGIDDFDAHIISARIYLAFN
jgi:hypothetical protein